MAYFFGLLIGAFLVSIIATPFVVLGLYCLHRIINFLWLALGSKYPLNSEFSSVLLPTSFISVVNGVILLLQGSPTGLVHIISGFMIFIFGLWLSERNNR